MIKEKKFLIAECDGCGDINTLDLYESNQVIVYETTEKKEFETDLKEMGWLQDDGKTLLCYKCRKANAQST